MRAVEHARTALEVRYVAVWGVIGLTVIGMLYYFYRKRWLCAQSPLGDRGGWPESGKSYATSGVRRRLCVRLGIPACLREPDQQTACMTSSRETRSL